MIHADISPTNLLLTTSGEVRVADFGIARREGGGGHGIVEGKWAYMAPEQARGEPLTPRSDVFALGVVLYELLTGPASVRPPGHRRRARRRRAARGHAAARGQAGRRPRRSRRSACARSRTTRATRYARMQHLIDALVEERFANGWREGASELAALIRATDDGRPRSLGDDDSRALVTASLIRGAEGTPAHGIVTPASPIPALPAPALEATDAGQAPMRPSLAEFTAVVAGAAVPPPALPAHARTLRLALIVLVLASLIGAIAAIASQSAPEHERPTPAQPQR